MPKRFDREADYTAADAMNDALVRAGVTHVFLNSGTDYPPIIESWAKCEALGRAKPEIIISPHETVAISAAQGFAQATGKPQAVFVHVDVGTQNLGGALHNAYRCRVPVFILAGLSPYTMEGELKGSRDSSIQFIQNAADQAGIVRGYTKHNVELKSGKNTQQMVYRALQIANSDPQGPVYMMATREALEEEGWDLDIDRSLWAPVAPMGLDRESLEILTDALAKAENPIVITSYLGRNEDSVGELVRLSERLALPVYDNAPRYVNFPANHPMHMGSMYQPKLKDADLVLVVDCDVPWMPAATKLRDDCKVFYLDVDPIKEDIPLWHIPAQRFIKADSHSALLQLHEKLDQSPGLLDQAKITRRFEEVKGQHERMHEQWKKEGVMKPELTADYVSACVAEIMNEDTILINETISAGGSVERQIPRTKPGTRYGCGGSSLGWFGGAAIGAKLAHPDRDVVALASDGVYIFSAPTAVYWMARRYHTPFITVVYNNQGWNAPKMITANQHPEGYAVKQNKFWTSFDPPSRLDLVAEAAGGALAIKVEKPEDMKPAIQKAREAVKNGTCAVINAILPPV